MSTLSDLLARSTEHAEGVAGTAVRIDGVATVLTGILDRSTHRQELGDGGFAPEANATLMMSKAQLDAVWIPCLGGQVTVGGRKYKVILVEEDDAGWRLGLMDVSQRRRNS